MNRLNRTTVVASTTRSFDLLIRDFAYINLRQHRARNFLLHHHSRRTFYAGATEPLRFHVEASELGDKRWRDDGAGLKITGYKDEDGVQVGDTIPLELEEGDGQWRKDDWTAEVDVVTPEGQVAAVSGDSAIADVELAGANMNTAGAATGAATGAALAGHSAAGGSKSRAESRLARRQRRELAGVYKPDATAREEQTGQDIPHEQEADDDAKDQDSVLSMIEKMDGPKLPKKLPSAKEKATKAARIEAAKAKKDENDTVGGKPGKTAVPLFRYKDYHGNEAKFKAKPTTPVEKPKPKRETWQVQKSANAQKFGNTTWQPRKRLSPDTLEGIRALHASDPATYSTETLSSQFEVSPENIRRILKSKWRPNDDEREMREKRWERRGVRKWTEMAELGERPPRRWREMGVGSVKGEPERKPGWKKGGKKAEEDSDDVGWMSDEFGERIL